MPQMAYHIVEPSLLQPKNCMKHREVKLGIKRNIDAKNGDLEKSL